MYLLCVIDSITANHHRLVCTHTPILNQTTINFHNNLSSYTKADNDSYNSLYKFYIDNVIVDLTELN